MSIQFSPVIAARSREGETFSVNAFELDELGGRASPVVVLDDFRVRGRPFPPHPHAGFSAVTYVFEDSPGGLRSRDSLGNDVVVGPGGIVWTQAGSGVIHHEVPEETGCELHGLQLFVNLSARNKLVAPQLFRLAPREVPQWLSNRGDRVRILVGSFGGVSSPLVPTEPFHFLDVELRDTVSFDTADAFNTIVYVVSGEARVCADGREQQVAGGQVMAIHGGGCATCVAVQPAHVIVLSGAEIREPVVLEGSFIMNERSEIATAVELYRAGAMGRLSSLPEC